ncbi:hypothetical protein IMCC3317_37710 [Kordia antarctica]|uniref:Uncharacterized protein n=1 Tax=Kordia antarctica TaxID=1218801 RepID=A0A7L4ZPI1_9FLAO|nr:hypothetical protein [Kordia antarctica]QHI38379.1 hypothetical protein IMCC3317_37710 [Kordia antarctica]
MKKKRFILNKLLLNKNLVSSLQGNSVVSGGKGQDSRPTVNTVELSHCIGIQGVPPTCRSVYPCA